MNMRWSLQELYPSFQCDELQNDLGKLLKSIGDIKSWCNSNLNDHNNEKDKIEYILKFQMSFKHLSSRIQAFANLTLSTEAKNAEALKIYGKVQQYVAELAKPMAMFQRWLGEVCDLDNLINSSELLKTHSFYLHTLSKKSKYALSDEEEALVAKLKNTGSNAWNQLQNTLTSTMLVDITLNGEEKHLPLPVARNLAFSGNSNTRKLGYEAELKSYDKIAESSAACLNGIKGEVITLAKERGYESALHETLENSRMDKETLDAMLTAMKESLPDFHKYYRRKAELLGHKKGLPFYDIFAPMGEVDKEYSYEEAREFIVKNFRDFSDKLANFADNAFENRWIDAEPREGKRGGAFCSNLHVIKESRILANFNGSFKNVKTLAHELGHGYHGFCLTEETPLNSSYPMPIAETASIFCETIVTNAALKSASKEEAFAILETDLCSNGQVIVDILSRYLFETELFKQREEGSLSVNELNDLMIKAQKEAYGDGLDHDYLHPYMWVNKTHYYYPNANFYNFPYAFGLLFSKGLYSKYLENPSEFVKNYDDLLAATGKNNLVDVANMMGIDIRSIDFWRSSLAIIREDIEKFLELSK